MRAVRSAVSRTAVRLIRASSGSPLKSMPAVLDLERLAGERQLCRAQLAPRHKCAECAAVPPSRRSSDHSAFDAAPAREHPPWRGDAHVELVACARAEGRASSGKSRSAPGRLISTTSSVGMPASGVCGDVEIGLDDARARR